MQWYGRYSQFCLVDHVIKVLFLLYTLRCKSLAKTASTTHPFLTIRKVNPAIHLIIEGGWKITRGLSNTWHLQFCASALKNSCVWPEYCISICKNHYFTQKTTSHWFYRVFIVVFLKERQTSTDYSWTCFPVHLKFLRGNNRLNFALIWHTFTDGSLQNHFSHFATLQ